jgi:uncharacterized protein YjiS (DUF1127 family)
MAQVIEWPGPRPAPVVMHAPNDNKVTVTGAVATLRLWRERAAMRRELRAMSDELLRDCGLDPRLARAEATRPFFVPLRLDRARA